MKYVERQILRQSLQEKVKEGSPLILAGAGCGTASPTPALRTWSRK